MKELLSNVMNRPYKKSLEDYLEGIGFNKGQAKAYVKFCKRTAKEPIMVEQIYRKKIPALLKEYPELAVELNKCPQITEICYAEKYLGNAELEFVLSEDCGIVTIIVNTR